MTDEAHAPPAKATPPRGIMRPVDVAAIWTEEARKAKPGRDPIRVQTVWAYGKESRIAGGRYVDNPMPAPDGYFGSNMNGPWWYDTPETRQAMRDWWNNRAGNGRAADGTFTSGAN